VSNFRYLRARDFRCFTDFRLDRERLESGVIHVVAENGKGKTSLAKLLEAGFRGIEADDVRWDTEKAEVMIGLEAHGAMLDIEQTRRRNRRAVVRKDGEVQKKPQSVLDTLAHAMSFSPRDFVGSKDQVSMILAYLGMSVPEGAPEIPNLSTDDPIEYVKAADKYLSGIRLEKKRRLTESEGAAKRFREEIPSDWNREDFTADGEARIETRLGQLREHRGEVKAWRERNASRVEEISKAKDELAAIPSDEELDRRKAAGIERDSTEIREQIAALQKKLAEVSEAWTTRVTTAKATAAAKRSELQRILETPTETCPHDEDAIEKEIEALQEKRQQSEKGKRWRLATEEAEKEEGRAETFREEVDILTAQIREIRAIPGELISNVDLPVEGLGVDDDLRLTLGGRPVTGLEESAQELLCLDLMAWVQSHYPVKILVIDGIGELGAERREKLLARCDELAEKDEFTIFVMEVAEDAEHAMAAKAAGKVVLE